MSASEGWSGVEHELLLLMPFAKRSAVATGASESNANKDTGAGAGG